VVFLSLCQIQTDALILSFSDSTTLPSQEQEKSPEFI